LQPPAGGRFYAYYTYCIVLSSLNIKISFPSTYTYMNGAGLIEFYELID